MVDSRFQPLLSTFALLEREAMEIRKQAVVDGLVVNPMMPPRRVWDLYSNRRVLLIWVVEPGLDIPSDSFQRIMSRSAVSRAWMLSSQRQDRQTRINWPAPLPKDRSLDDIRIELLNMWAEYAWLDVLCLR